MKTVNFTPPHLLFYAQLRRLFTSIVMVLFLLPVLSIGQNATLCIGNDYVDPNDPGQVRIPVTVEFLPEDFPGFLGMNINLQLILPNVIGTTFEINEPATLASVNPLIPPGSDFVFTNGTFGGNPAININFTYFDQSVEVIPNDLPFTIFEIVICGQPNQSGYLLINQGSINSYLDQFNVVDFTLNTCSFFQFFSFGGAQISGTILKPSFPTQNCLGSINNGVPGVDVTLKEDSGLAPCAKDLLTTTDANGAFFFEAISGTDQTISPNNNEDFLCGNPIDENNAVNLVDLNMIQEQVIQVQPPFTDHWQKIAADVDNDGLVTTGDVVLVQLGIVTGTNSWTLPSWVYVPVVEYNNFPVYVNDVQVPGYSTTISLLNVGGNNLDNDFFGIKAGDVDASCSACQGENELTSPGSEERQLISTRQVHIQSSSSRFEVNELIELTFSTVKFSDETVFGGVISFSEKHFEIIEIGKSKAVPFCENFKIVKDEAMNQLRMAWFRGDEYTPNKSKGLESLFTVKLKVLNKFDSLEGLIKASQNTGTTAFYHQTGAVEKWDFQFSRNNKLAVYPNPAEAAVQLKWRAETPNSTVCIFNQQGQLMLQKEQGGQGEQNLGIDLQGFASGVYLVHVNNGGLIYSEKLINGKIIFN